MDEQQALLGRSVRPSLFISSAAEGTNRVSQDYRDVTYDVEAASSSDGSDTSWEDYHSSCSSCSHSEYSEEEWEANVKEDGSLLFLETSKAVTCEESARATETTEAVTAPIVRSIIDKQGKFVRWIRRRESKRMRPRLSAVVSGQPSSSSHGKQEKNDWVTTAVDVPRMQSVGVDALGLDVAVTKGEVGVRAVLPDGPLAQSKLVQAGDLLKQVDGQKIVTLDDLTKKMSSLATPCQLILAFEKVKEPSVSILTSEKSKLAQLVEGRSTMKEGPEDIPLSVLVVNIGEAVEETADSDLVYCYPPDAKFAAGRGAFVTLNHLLPTVAGSECKSCVCEVDGGSIHVVFHKEENLLLLLIVPDKICRAVEANLLTADLVRCLSFSHQTLQCCFRKESSVLDVFFASFFARLLVSQDKTRITQELHHFHEFLPEATWVPLPREAQLQLDDALNELESCDFGVSDDNTTESDREYIILGTCLYHQGYLLASHLHKQDLQDIHSLLRSNGIQELSRKEGVARLVIWREIFPSSVNRGLPPSSLQSMVYPPPVGRWFLLVVSTGHDLLAVILENAGCCIPLPQELRPCVTLVREAEDTLAHVQSLGLTNLAAQWLSARNRPVTTSRTSVPAKGTLLRSVANNHRSTNIQEDTFSQAPSNLSNPSNTSNASESDETAPILGRRAERTLTTTPAAALAAVRELSDDSQSESSESDSDWGSFNNVSLYENSSSLFDNPYMPSNVGDLDEITPSKITTGPENQLFHYISIDGNEGVVVTSGVDSKPPSGLFAKFTEAAHKINTQLQQNVRFRAVADPRGVANRTLSVVKESGMLIDFEDKPYWVVGRLFFTPKPKAVFVCYSDDAPQNMLELAFRIGLSAAG